jgi:hypothetical protein
MADPVPTAMFDNVYALDHPLIARERETFEHYVSSFSVDG